MTFIGQKKTGHIVCNGFYSPFFFSNKDDIWLFNVIQLIIIHAVKLQKKKRFTIKSCFLFVNTIYFCLTTSRLYQMWVGCGNAGGANSTSDIDNNSALTWHKIDIRMRLRIGENAEYVYQILCLYTAIINDINGYYYQYSNYLKKLVTPKRPQLILVK